MSLRPIYAVNTHELIKALNTSVSRLKPVQSEAICALFDGAASPM